MNQNTRQRLTGTLVLAVAALILLPVIFDGEGSYQPVVQTEIPSRPAQPQAGRSLPQRPVITADTDAIRIDRSSDTEEPETDAAGEPVADNTPEDPPEDSQPTAAAEPAAPVAEDTETAQADTSTAPPPPALDNRGLPEGFSVRLASFGNATNASNLVTRLQEAGHRAYTRRLDSSQGVLTAVFVGPVVDRNAATTLLERLRQDFQLNGMIVRYEIEEL